MIHIYTGDGKGKTTAALGLALRAAGAKKKVCIIQFIKKGVFSEIKALTKIKNISLYQYGRGFIKDLPSDKDKQAAKKGFCAAREQIYLRKCEMLILDECITALNLKLLGLEQILLMMNKIPPSIELVLTGRKAPRKLCLAADYVTEMKEIRHPFKKCQPPRKGIEF